METKANYVLIGAFTIVVGIALLLFGLWAAKYSSDRTWQEYRVVFREAVTGLSVGSPVQYNGIAVGSITELTLAPNDPRQVVARIRVNSTTPVKSDTRAKLGITSLTGPTIIQLSGGTPEAPKLTAIDNNDAPIIQTTPSALQNITDTANHIVERLDQVLSDSNVASITATLHNLEKISGALADRDNGVQSLMLSARDATRHLDETLSVLGVDTDSGRREDRLHVERNTGVLFQDGALFSSLSVGENVQVPLKEHFAELPDSWHYELALLKVKLAGLPADALNKLPSQLSGGMRKRAGLARALALDPPLLFLDEPTAGLDPIGAAAFDRLIRTLQEALGLTVFLITHDLDTLYAICDRVAVLADGKVIANAPLAEIEQVDHPWIQDYFHGPRARAARDAKTHWIENT
nr:MlaD family protein [Xanthomonas sp. MUS 060]